MIVLVVYEVFSNSWQSELQRVHDKFMQDFANIFKTCWCSELRMCQCEQQSQQVLGQ